MDIDDEYLRALSLGRDERRLPEDLERDPRWLALKRAHELRQFEIDLYWKRSTYFFALQAAAFTAFGLSLPSPSKVSSPLFVVIFASLGFLTALAGALSTRGSKFWQENWEKHIDELQGPYEGALYRALWVRKGSADAWSVSRINEVLTAAFTTFWLLVLIWTVTIACNPNIAIGGADALTLGVVWVLVGTTVVFTVLLLTRGSRPTKAAGVERTQGTTAWELRLRG